MDRDLEGYNDKSGRMHHKMTSYTRLDYSRDMDELITYDSEAMGYEDTTSIAPTSKSSRTKRQVSFVFVL